MSDGKEKPSGRFEYGEYTRKKYSLILMGALVCILAYFVDFLFSSTYLNPADLLNTLFKPDEATQTMKVIVFNLKIPQVTIALIVGAAFGLSGAVMQTMLNNPLASPYTLGISAGAGFGASLAMVLGLGSLAVLGTYAIPAFAFVFSLLACGGIYLIARMKGFSAEVMVLAGIGLVFFFQALQALMQYLASPEALQGIVFWTFGSVSGANWTNIPMILVIFLIFFFAIYRKSWVLTAMKLGDNKAKALGVDTDKIRKILFVSTSLLTATCVAFVGCIGFIGIVGPHVARMIIGEDQRFFLPMSCVCGAALLVIADFASKFFGNGVVFPIGILTSLVGVPFFFYLLMKKRTVRN